MVIAASLFGTLGVLSRGAYGLGLDPFAFVTWRAGIGALVLGLVIAVNVRRGTRLVGWRSLDPRGRVALGTAAFMGATLNMAMFLAFARAPIAIVLLCFYLYPAIVTAVSAALGWEPMDRQRAVALSVALAGMVAVVIGGPASATAGGVDPLGVVLALSAAASQAVFVLVSRHGYRDVPTDQAMGVILGVSAVLAAALALVSGGPGTLVLPIASPGLLLLVVTAGILAAAVPSFLFLLGIRWIGPVKAGILMLVEPLVGVGLAALLLHEAVGPVQALGGIAILAAALLIQRARPTEAALIPAAEPEPVEVAENGFDRDADDGSESLRQEVRDRP